MDPNFEANRLEYKQNREIAEGKTMKRESRLLQSAWMRVM